MIITLVLFGLTAVYFFQVISLPMGNMARVGPGAYPVLIALLMFACLSVVLVRDIKNKRTGKPKDMVRFTKQSVAVALTVVYSLVLEWAGYYLSTFLFASAMAWLFGSMRKETKAGMARSVAVSLAIGAGITIAGYVLFHMMFGFRLP